VAAVVAAVVAAAVVVVVAVVSVFVNVWEVLGADLAVLLEKKIFLKNRRFLG
jgi:hypothetical protein